MQVMVHLGMWHIPAVIAYLPSIEFCLTSCAQSSSVSGGMSSTLAPSGSLRYTWALLRSST